MNNLKIQTEEFDSSQVLFMFIIIATSLLQIIKLVYNDDSMKS